MTLSRRCTETDCKQPAQFNDPHDPRRLADAGATIAVATPLRCIAPANSFSMGRGARVVRRFRATGTYIRFRTCNTRIDTVVGFNGRWCKYLHTAVHSEPTSPERWPRHRFRDQISNVLYPPSATTTIRLTRSCFPAGRPRSLADDNDNCGSLNENIGFSVTRSRSTATFARLFCQARATPRPVT